MIIGKATMSAEQIRNQLEILATAPETLKAFKGREWVGTLFAVLCAICRTQVEILNRMEKHD